MTKWWYANCKSCHKELAIRPSESTPEKLDLGGMGAVKNPVTCEECGTENRFAYGDVHEALRKDDPTSLG